MLVALERGAWPAAAPGRGPAPRGHPLGPPRRRRAPPLIPRVGRGFGGVAGRGERRLRPARRGGLAPHRPSLRPPRGRSPRAEHKGVRPLYVEPAEAVRYDLRPGRPDLVAVPAGGLAAVDGRGGAGRRGRGARLSADRRDGAAAGGAGRVPGAGARDARDGRGRARVPGGGAGVHHDRGRAGSGAGGGRGPGARGDPGVAAGARARAGADAGGRGRDRGPRAAVQRARDPRHARPPVPDGRRDVAAPAGGPAAPGRSGGTRS